MQADKWVSRQSFSQVGLLAIAVATLTLILCFSPVPAVFVLGGLIATILVGLCATLALVNRRLECDSKGLRYWNWRGNLSAEATWAEVTSVKTSASMGAPEERVIEVSTSKGPFNIAGLKDQPGLMNYMGRMAPHIEFSDDIKPLLTGD